MRKILKFLCNLIPFSHLRRELRKNIEPVATWEENGLKIEKWEKHINVFKDDDCIRISLGHEIYIYDLKHDFYLYHSAVESKKWRGYNLVDYSKESMHKVKGYDLHKIWLPSFTEPLSAVKQYIDFAQLNENSVVLDLGSYCGLSAILFDQAISKQNKKAKGRVITVDADLRSKNCIIKNLEAYKRKTKRRIDFLLSAVWSEDGEIEFASEGHLAASVYNIKRNRGTVIKVPTITLSSIAKKYNLEKIDFIKCDIEGAEIEIFKDKEFFKNFSPKIILETHYMDDDVTLTEEIVIKQLADYGYICKRVHQEGFELPLLECVCEKMVEGLAKTV